VDELRQKRDAEAARALQVNADNLMHDLSEFAQRNSNLVPLEVEPLVAALKESLVAKDLKRSSTAFATLQARLEEVPEFRQFRTTREEARKDAAKAELDELRETVRTTSEFIES
jgi:hypothetical protein